MINEDLLGFVKEQLKKDISREIISQKLLNAKWSRQDIAEVFQEVDRQIKAGTFDDDANIIGTGVKKIKDIKKDIFGDLLPF